MHVVWILRKILEVDEQAQIAWPSAVERKDMESTVVNLSMANDLVDGTKFQLGHFQKMIFQEAMYHMHWLAALFRADISGVFACVDAAIIAKIHDRTLFSHIRSYRDPFLFYFSWIERH